MTDSQTVLITGCSTGIGRATAERLNAAGMTVYATARTLNHVKDLKKDGCHTLALDVTDEESMEAAVSTVIDEQGSIDALVNNAGYSQSGAVEDISMDSIRRQFETNVFGLIRMSQLVLPAMREQGSGRIVNIGSMGGRLTFPGGGIYHSTKYAVEAISDAMRFEVKEFGVRVVLIEPGLIRTQFAHAVAQNLKQPSQTDGAYDQFNEQILASTEGVYQNPVLAKLGGDADAVAKVIEKALTSSKPKARYPVTLSAHAMINQRKFMPDRVWDAFVGTQMKPPQPRKEQT